MISVTPLGGRGTTGGVEGGGAEMAFLCTGVFLQISPSMYFTTGREPPANGAVSACNPGPEKTTESIWLQKDHRIY